LVAAALKPMMVSSGGLGGTILEPEKFSDAAALLSEIFDVNPVVAQYRLEDLYRLEKNGQMML
jgi:hypothetical protein